MNDEPKQPRQMHLSEAVQRVMDAPPLPGWMDRARGVIRQLASTGDEFTAEDLKRHVPNPPHLNCIGTAFKLASEAGIIERCGWSVSTGKAAHGRHVMRWKGKGT